MNIATFLLCEYFPPSIYFPILTLPIFSLSENTTVSVFADREEARTSGWEFGDMGSYFNSTNDSLQDFGHYVSGSLSMKWDNKIGFVAAVCDARD